MFQVREIIPHVYHFRFDSAYDLAMHFLRYQEYYESPKWYCRIFALTEFMEWYAKEQGNGVFSYPDDWSGFNVPSWVVWQVNDATLPDPNAYDDWMRATTRMICRREGNHPFYLIGTSNQTHVDSEESEKSVLQHEIAHALYTVEPGYGGQVDKLISEWENKDKGRLENAKSILIEMGYHESTVNDEIHAYCATGLCTELQGSISKEEMRPFRKLLDKWWRKLRIDRKLSVP